MTSLVEPALPAQVFALHNPSEEINNNQSYETKQGKQVDDISPQPGDDTTPPRLTALQPLQFVQPTHRSGSIASTASLCVGPVTSVAASSQNEKEASANTVLPPLAVINTPVIVAATHNLHTGLNSNSQIGISYSAETPVAVNIRTSLPSSSQTYATSHSSSSNITFSTPYIKTASRQFNQNNSTSTTAEKLSEMISRSPPPPSTPAPSPMLPPCRVCGEKASGFHYGANTCEACKGFFMRSLRRHRQYRCAANDNCNIIGRTKNNKCPKCRLERCLAIGMSRGGIKNGRYSHQKKTEYIMEVKALEKGEEVPRLAGPPEVPAQKEDKQQNFSRDEELEAIIQHMTKVYYENTDCTPEFLQGKARREREYWEQQQEQQEAPLSASEYLAARRSTGQDVDGREVLVHRLNQKANDFASQLINFAKAIPGFTDIDKDDQVALVKNAARNGCFMIMQHKKFNIEKRLYHSFCGTLYDEQTINKFYTKDQIDMMFAVVEKVINMNFSDEEMVMSAAVGLLLADKYELKNSLLVEKSMNTCLRCVMYLFSRDRPGDRFRFPRLVEILTELRSMEHQVYTARKFEDTFHLELNQIYHELSS